MAVKNCFIRGSVVRYVQLPASAMDTQLLEDATRRGRGLFFDYLCTFLTFSFHRGREHEQEVNILYFLSSTPSPITVVIPKQSTVLQYPERVSKPSTKNYI